MSSEMTPRSGVQNILREARGYVAAHHMPWNPSTHVPRRHWDYTLDGVREPYRPAVNIEKVRDERLYAGAPPFRVAPVKLMKHQVIADIVGDDGPVSARIPRNLAPMPEPSAYTPRPPKQPKPDREHRPKGEKKSKKDKAAAPSASSIEVPSKEKCLELFKRLDPNGNGMLSLAELDKGVVELWPTFNNKPAIMRAYKAADKSGEGFVTRSEFEFFLRYLTYYNNLWSTFDAMDTGDDRRVTKEEFAKFAPKLQIADADAAFAEMDENGGGFVLFDEFCAWMAKNKSTWGEVAREYSDDDGAAASLGKPKVNKTKKTPAKGPPPAAAMNIQVPPKAKCMEVFNQLDPNGNGMLSLAELDKGVIELWPNFNNKPAIMRAYKAADRSGEGFITRKEFGFFLRFLTYFNNLWRVFDEIDTSDDRRITKEEFVANAAKLGVDSPELAFEEMDENGGGFVLFDEFCAWMAKNKSDWGDDE